VAKVAKPQAKAAKPKAKTAKTAKPGKVKLSLGLPDAAPKRGRPIEYQPKFAEIVGAMAKLGGTDFEIAEELGVSTSTLWRWRSKYSDLSRALNEGRDAFDDRAERSLAQKAIGYTFHAEKVFQFEGQVVRADIVEHIPPDVGALKMWLGNRPRQMERQAGSGRHGSRGFRWVVEGNFLECGPHACQGVILSKGFFGSKSLWLQG
jgi:hypothetical protein